MIKVLVFGKSGQLAKSLAQCAPDYRQIDLHFVDRTQCDLAQSDAVAVAIENACPDIVINAAAYTAVDQAEGEPEKAQAVNCDAVRAMADATEKRSIPLIHFSTDYVFDGTGTAPYRETDVTAPLGVYGKTKLAGEDAIRTRTARHLIFRTSWVYSPYGKNFVKTMLRLMVQNEEIRVVDDQVGCPTSAQDLAETVLKIVSVVLVPGFDRFGTYHLVSRDEMTWCGFARQIKATAQQVFGDQWAGAQCSIVAVSSYQFPTVAKRPNYSVLSVSKFTNAFGFGLPGIERSLRKTLMEMAKGDAHA